MIYQELSRYLTDEEKMAVEYLESIGYQVLTEARLDDCKKKDGRRVRTFSLSGRYDLIIGLKSVRGRPVPESVDDSGDEEVEVEVEAEADSVDVEEEGAVIGDNFWMNRDRWHRMNREGFRTLVVEEAVDDLKAAPLDVQEDVKEKFLRFFDESEWPLE